MHVYIWPHLWYSTFEPQMPLNVIYAFIQPKFVGSLLCAEGMSKFFCKATDSKYFMFWGKYTFSVPWSLFLLPLYLHLFFLPLFFILLLLLCLLLFFLCNPLKKWSVISSLIIHVPFIDSCVSIRATVVSDEWCW